MNTPNVLFILADDLGWGDVSYHGSTIATPNIDRLARLGVEFDQHYVCPVCTPTRVALLTGRYPARFGKHATWPTNDPVLPEGYQTMASMFRAAGYTTSLFGKWHLGSSGDDHPGCYGFDTSYGSLAGGVDPYTHLYKSGPFSRTWHRDGKLVQERGHATDLITDAAIRWIEEQITPWFCYLPFTAVHIPVNAPEEWIDRYERTYTEGDPLVNRSLKLYGAYVSHMDHCVGRLIEALKCSCCLDNTIIIFTSDNGAPTVNLLEDIERYPGFHESLAGVGSNQPLRGGKTTLYEGGIRTPAALLWPGRLASKHLTAPCTIGDWFPTFAEMLGAAADDRWDGQSLWRLLTEDESYGERTLHWNVLNNYFAVRRGDWKLICRGADISEAELFDLAHDPWERQNVAEQHPELVAELQKCIEENRIGDESDVRVRSSGSPFQSADYDP